LRRPNAALRPAAAGACAAARARQRRRAAPPHLPGTRRTPRCAAAQVWEMHALLEEGMRSGEVAPLPWTVFARGKTQDAFRYLASGAARARGPVP